MNDVALVLASPTLVIGSEVGRRLARTMQLERFGDCTENLGLWEPAYRYFTKVLRARGSGSAASIEGRKSPARWPSSSGGWASRFLIQDSCCSGFAWRTSNVSQSDCARGFGLGLYGPSATSVQLTE